MRPDRLSAMAATESAGPSMKGWTTARSFVRPNVEPRIGQSARNSSASRIRNVSCEPAPLRGLTTIGKENVDSHAEGSNNWLPIVGSPC